MRIWVMLLLVVMLVGLAPVLAQDAEVVVPDVTGLSLPQAVSALNAAGLELGQLFPVVWTEGTSQPVNSVSAQSLAAGTSVLAGESVSLIVLRAANMRIIYTDISMTLINLSDNPARLDRLNLAGIGNGALFVPARLVSELRPQGCLQIWSVARTGPARPDDCEAVQRWQVISNTDEHFWTGTAGAQEFDVLNAGLELISCPAAPAGTRAVPMVCDFFYSEAGAGDLFTEYLYFAYTTEALAIINVSDDRWMPTTVNPIYNSSAPTARVGDLTTWGPDFQRSPGDLTLLAPGQCVLLTSASAASDAPPDPCQVVAQQSFDQGALFWLADFEIESLEDGRRSVCPGAIEEQPTMCIVPR